MYRVANQGLGFSLKPPSWLTNILKVGQTGISVAQAAANETQRVFDAAGAPRSGGVPAITTPTQLRATGDPGGMPSWLLPVAAVGIGLLLFSRRR